MSSFLSQAKPANKRFLVRLDLDLPLEKGKFDTTRLEDGVATVQYLLDNGASKITIIGHRGRPGGKKNLKYSMKPIEKLLLKYLKKDQEKKVTVLDNLRFSPGEEKNLEGFAKKLAKGHDFFVNDSFAASHREHASIVGIPKILPSYFGLQFQKEIEGLRPIIEGPKRPYVLILGGAKGETKLPLMEPFKEKADVILVGGKLASQQGENPVTNRKLILAKLEEHGKDISFGAIEQFLRFVAMAKTIVWNGPLGMIEKEEYRTGTRAIAEAISRSPAYTVVGGGDTEAALSLLNISKGINFVSSGGGAMLEYLAYGTLPGIEAVKNSTPAPLAK